MHWRKAIGKRSFFIISYLINGLVYHLSLVENGPSNYSLKSLHKDSEPVICVVKFLLGVDASQLKTT